MVRLLLPSLVLLAGLAAALPDIQHAETYTGGTGDVGALCAFTAVGNVGGACFPNYPRAFVAIDIRDDLLDPTGGYFQFDDGGFPAQVFAEGAFCDQVVLENPLPGQGYLVVLVDEVWGSTDCYPQPGAGTRGTIETLWFD